ncbi:MAG: histidine kinase [Tetrasphaera sp.]
MSTERDLVLAQERTRAARELHDGLGHRLTLVAMSFEYAQRMRHRDPEPAWAEIENAAKTNQEALDHMRLWVRAAPPESLPDPVNLFATRLVQEG